MSTTKKRKSIFMNDTVIMSVIILNALVIFFQGYFNDTQWLSAIDVLLTIFFWIEAAVKIRTWSFKSYWRDGWNKFDLIVISLSTLAFLQYIWVDTLQMPINLLIFRVFRVFRVLKSARISHFVKSARTIVDGIRLGLKAGSVIFIGFFILLFIVSMLSFEIFNDICPEYFQTPLTSVYSTFQLFTIEGWYDIPNTVCACITSPHKNIYHFLVKSYFVLQLFIGGIMGMSFINSIVVDAMLSDNNDEVLKEIRELKTEISELKEQLNQRKDNNSKT